MNDNDNLSQYYGAQQHDALSAQRQMAEAQKLTEQFSLVRLLGSAPPEPEPEYLERDGKRYRLWRPSDQDPRGRAYIPVNALITACESCGMVGGQKA